MSKQVTLDNFLNKKEIPKDSFGEIPDQVIINEYLPGQGIAPHTDSKIFGEFIFSLSLGSESLNNGSDFTILL